MRRRHIAAATAVTALGFAAAHHAPAYRPTTHAEPVKPRKHTTVRDALQIRVSPRPVSRSQPTRAPLPEPVAPTPRVVEHAGDPTAAQWADLRACEASGDYTLHDPPYYGAYQFDLSTWRATLDRMGVAFAGLPSDAAPALQDAAALALWRDRGWQPWPVCGYAKWGAR